METLPLREQSSRLFDAFTCITLASRRTFSQDSLGEGRRPNQRRGMLVST